MEKLTCTPTRSLLLNLSLFLTFFVTTAHFNPDNTFYHWTGQKSTDWHDPNNWWGGIIPDSNSNVYIPNVPTKKFPTLDGLIQLKHLKIEQGAKLKVSMSGILTIAYLKNGGLLFGDGTIDGLPLGGKIDNYGIIDSVVIGDRIKIANKKGGWNTSVPSEQMPLPSEQIPLIDNGNDSGQLIPTKH